MQGKLLIDFGSTFTKAVYVDLDRNEIASAARHYSTVDTDVTKGLKACLDDISADLGEGVVKKTETLACSSAAGGLRIVCIGFVPDYSSKAANLAALGAGAKVVGCFSHDISRREVDEIRSLEPDIILLTGGTDGGNTKVILHNARMLASRPFPGATVIVAGNKSAEDDISQILQGAGQKTRFCKNVMPEVGRLDVEDCNRAIRELFIDSIIEAKGIGRARRLIGDVLMPTPLAVLKACRLLSDGWGGEQGIGETLVVDVGGATTDVHSVSDGKPAGGVAVRVGLPEPYEKRTVEGDLGLKYNLDHLLKLYLEKEPETDVDGIVEKFKRNGFTPGTAEEIEWHTRLSHLAVETAVGRHAGRIEVHYGPSGEMHFQHGKDLRRVASVVGTGGPVAFAANPVEVLGGAVFREDEVHLLKPQSPAFFLDSHYVLFAGGLMNQASPEKALRFMKKHLKRL